MAGKKKYRLLRWGEILRKGDQVKEEKWETLRKPYWGDRVLCFMGDWRRPIINKGGKGK